MDPSSTGRWLATSAFLAPGLANFSFSFRRFYGVFLSWKAMRIA